MGPGLDHDGHLKHCSKSYTKDWPEVERRQGPGEVGFTGAVNAQGYPLVLYHHHLEQ